jgi:formate dehydrogenase accessory protein FdhE
MVNMKNIEYDLKNAIPVSSDVIVKRLAEIERDAPELDDVVRTYGAILPLLNNADLHVEPVTMTNDQARKKLEAGLPLLHDTDIEIDLYAVTNLIATLINAAGGVSTTASGSSMKLALQEGRLDVFNIASLAIAGEKEKIMHLARTQTLDPELLWTLAKFSIKPAYFAVLNQVGHFIDDITWDKGICPVCGAMATLGELRDNNLTKYLRCGQCGAGWRTRRMQCHLCQNEDHRTLKVLYMDDKPGKERVEVCDRCKGYLKVVTTFSPIAPELIALEDLATLYLDFAVQKSGYIPNPDKP